MLLSKSELLSRDIVKEDCVEQGGRGASVLDITRCSCAARSGVEMEVEAEAKKRKRSYTIYRRYKRYKAKMLGKGKVGSGRGSLREVRDQDQDNRTDSGSRASGGGGIERAIINPNLSLPTHTSLQLLPTAILAQLTQPI